MASSRSRLPEGLADRVWARLAPLVGSAGVAPGLLLAFSGGLDSTVLLHVLAGLARRFSFPLRVRHVHHGLSDYAEAWCEHCRLTCAALSVPLEVLRVEVGRDDPAGLEAAARWARYQALRTNWSGWILLAHHADDQAETLLFRLARGAGVRGAVCMRGIDPGQRLVRPLLAETRSCLENYARTHGLKWVEDDSNPDERFSRNYLRHQVLTPLRKRFPAAAANLARSATVFEETDQLLTELAGMDCERLCFGRAGSRERLRALSSARARNVLRFCLHRENALLPEWARLEDGLKQLCGEAAVRWVFGETALCAYRDKIWLEPALLPVVKPCVWQGEPSLSWGGGRVLISSSREKVLSLEARQPGMHWRFAPDRPARAFKLLCQEAGIPPWWRDRLPCVWSGGTLLWIGGLGQSDEFIWEDAAFLVAEGD